MGRLGEGVPLSASIEHKTGIDGSSYAIIGFDFASAPVPERRYIADAFAVVPGSGAIRLVFAQRRLVGHGLRTALVVHVGLSALNRFLTTLPQATTGTSFEKIDEQQNVSAEPPVELNE